VTNALLTDFKDDGVGISHKIPKGVDIRVAGLAIMNFLTLLLLFDPTSSRTPGRPTYTTVGSVYKPQQFQLPQPTRHGRLDRPAVDASSGCLLPLGPRSFLFFVLLYIAKLGDPKDH